MKQLVFSMFDVKAREYGTLVLAANDAHVIRSIKVGIPGSGSLMEQYPEDFHLMLVGEFDSETGVLRAAVTPTLVTTVREALEVRNGG